jgi:hypothetical protein
MDASLQWIQKQATGYAMGQEPSQGGHCSKRRGRGIIIMVRHQYTVEKLFHFTCSGCKRWWSYATDEYYEIDDKEIFCMHCGAKGKIEDKYKK